MTLPRCGLGSMYFPGVSGVPKASRRGRQSFLRVARDVDEARGASSASPSRAPPKRRPAHGLPPTPPPPARRCPRRPFAAAPSSSRGRTRRTWTTRGCARPPRNLAFAELEPLFSMQSECAMQLQLLAPIIKTLFVIFFLSLLFFSELSRAAGLTKTVTAPLQLSQRGRKKGERGFATPRGTISECCD